MYLNCGQESIIIIYLHIYELKGDFLHPSPTLGTICAQYVRSYLGTSILWKGYFTNLLLFFPSFSFVSFCRYIFSFDLSFFACQSVLLIFPFQMCSSQKCGASSLPHSLAVCSHGLAASRKQFSHQKRKAPFVLIWLVLSAGSFRLCLTVFATARENSKKLWKPSPAARIPTAFLVLPNL